MNIKGEENTEMTVTRFSPKRMRPWPIALYNSDIQLERKTSKTSALSALIYKTWSWRKMW